MMKQWMKKSLILFLAVCLTAASAAVSAAGSITLDPLFDIDAGELIVKGSVSSTKGSIPMVLTVTRGETLVTAEQIVTGAAADGVVSFAFTGIPFENTTPSGDYSIYVSADFVKEEATDVYSYIGADRRFAAMTALNAAIAASSSANLVQALEDYKGLFCSGDEALFSLGSDAQAVFSKLFIAKGSYTLPADYASDTNVEIITAAVQAAAANYTELLVLASAADLTDEAKLTAWLDKYAEAKGFYLDDAATAYDEVELGKYFDQARGTDRLYTKIAAAASKATDFAALKAGMLEAGVLTLIETGKAYTIQEITEALPALFTVNQTGFNALSDSRKTAVYQDLTGGSYQDVAAYIAAFNQAVTDNTPTGTSTGGSTGGSSSSRGSRGDTSFVLPAVESTPSQGQTPAVAGFNDLEHYAWAHEAISYLQEKGIVSGRDSDTFDPAAPVTRGEFIKMVTLAFGLEEGVYNSSFTDVSAEDWYAPYVAAAHAAGIAEGDGGRFMPTERITRQDMAVLLYRAKGWSPSANEKDVFSDLENISGYAKSPVFALYEKGIVLGGGDGSFEPLRDAARAEAAQMIYRMMMAA